MASTITVKYQLLFEWYFHGIGRHNYRNSVSVLLRIHLTFEKYSSCISVHLPGNPTA